MEDEYFWKKNGRPPVEKDNDRNSIAKLCLSHLKKSASIMKTTYSDCISNKAESPDDFQSNVIYSINKKSRWEIEESIGVDLLDELSKLNIGWNVIIVERIVLHTFSWPVCICEPLSETFENFYAIRTFHYLTGGNEYHRTSINSIFGKLYSSFLKECPVEIDGADTKNECTPSITYNILRAPTNYLVLLKKQFQDSNFGHDWPRVGYWKRLERHKESVLQLRYEKIENLNEDYEHDEHIDPDLDHHLKLKSLCYNLEEHVVDRFTFVKRRRRVKTSTCNN